MQQHGSNYFARIPPPPLPYPREWGQNKHFSEHGHVAYKIN